VDTLPSTTDLARHLTALRLLRSSTLRLLLTDSLLFCRGSLRLPHTFVDGDCFLDLQVRVHILAAEVECLVFGITYPRQTEKVAPPQILFPYTATVRTNRSNLVAKDEIEITSLCRKPPVDKVGRIVAASVQSNEISNGSV
jgi:hypothetical protein